MGTGKTFIAAAAAHMAGFKRILVLGPPHLVPKWKREVEMTVPGARAVIVRSITDLERLRISVGSGPLFAVMSREKAKLSYRWMPAVIQRWAVSKGRLLREEETGEPFRVPCCPDCTAQIVDKDGVPLTEEDLNRRKHTCAGCGSPLWQADRSGPARYPLADYVKQTRPVKVVFMSYRNTLQADALKLVAKKLQSSLAVEGELPEDGLAAYGDDGDDLMMALARKIVSGGAEDDESVEAVLAQARDAEALSEELLVDDGWHAVEVEPELVEAHRNGTRATVEVGASNDYHHDEAPETQQSLFSWAEFMAEEPVKPSRRNGKQKTATLSMFEWALSLEEEKEAQTVS